MSPATLLWSLLTFPGCGGATAMPLAPSAVHTAATATQTTSAAAAPSLSAARLERVGNGTWLACFGVGAAGYSECAFQGTVRNAGAGCASAIRGIVRFYDAGRTEMGAYAWTIDGPPTGPNQSATYRTAAVPIAIVNATAGYDITDVAWTDVACR